MLFCTQKPVINYLFYLDPGLLESLLNPSSMTAVTSAGVGGCGIGVSEIDLLKLMIKLKIISKVCILLGIKKADHTVNVIM